MKPRLERGVLWGALALGLAVLVLMGLAAALVGSTLEATERDRWASWWGEVMAGRWPLLALLWLGLVAAEHHADGGRS